MREQPQQLSRVQVWLEDLLKPPFLLSMLVLGASGVAYTQSLKRDVSELEGKVAELRTSVIAAISENVEQRIALSRLTDVTGRIDLQLERFNRLQERQGNDISRLLILASGQNSPFRQNNLVLPPETEPEQRETSRSVPNAARPF